MTNVLTDLLGRFERDEPDEPASRRNPDGGVHRVEGGERLTGRILRALPGDNHDGRRARVSPTELDAAVLCDRNGKFCEATFEQETGYTTTEFVLEYVDSHGGGVRQQAIVECLPWSASKVSRLLADLECDGRIVRRSIGREKVVFLPDSVPVSAQ